MGGTRTFTFSEDTLSPGETLAIESKQDTANSSLAGIAADVRPMSGAGIAGTKDLTSANTWYALPSSVPSSDYVLVVSKENVSGQVRWSFDNTSTPSSTYGNKFSTLDIIFELAANQVVYFSSSTAGDDLNWTTKII